MVLAVSASLAFRQMSGAEGFVVAINDLTSPKMLAHLLKYDSTQGNYAAQGHVVEAGEDFITRDGQEDHHLRQGQRCRAALGRAGC